MSQATPRPWRVNKYGSVGAGATGTVPIVAEIQPFYGADLRYGSHSANAALIVRAVNAHDALVEALERLLRMPVNGVPLRDWEDDNIKNALDALAKARGEP